jgi:sugar O-acyltransferase (sialic acid O-acetyltransferase NeuD family)
MFIKPVVIFGNQDSASTTNYYLKHDSNYEVVGFTVDSNRMTSEIFENLPLIPFEFINSRFPPDEVDFIFPAGFQLNHPLNTNIFRKNRYEIIKNQGYQCINYISSKALVANNAHIGENVLIYEGAIVQPFVSIGDNCIIRSGANIGHHSSIQSHCFISAEVTIGSRTSIGTQAFIGLNTTILNSINVSSNVFIGAGSFINCNIDKNSKVIGISS